MKKISLFIISFGVLLNASAQKRPFPQQQNWENCIKPTNYTQTQLNADVRAYYDHWKTSYLVQANTGGYYIQGENTGGGSSDKGTSEGHGYGMIITALMAGHDANAKVYFDGLYRFFDTHRSSINNKLMGWLIDANETGTGRYSSASDGDMDIAYSLLLAHYQWGSTGEINYLQKAKDMITLGIKASDMSTQTKRVLLGDWSSNQYNTRPSDWMTSHMRAYYHATNDNFWNEAVNEIYSMMSTITTNNASTTGLMPDFVVGTTPVPASANFLEGPHDGNFYYNAGRFPWRIGMDYGHYGSQSAKTQLTKVLNWIKPLTSNNPSNIKPGYKLNGQDLGTNYFDAVFVAPMVLASTIDAAHQDYLNSGWTAIRNRKSNYFSDNINLLCMLYISGNWWVPTEEIGGCIDALNLGETITLCNPAQATIHTNLNPEQFSFQWKKDGNTLGETGASLLVSQSGNYSCTVTRQGCNAVSGLVEVTSSLPEIFNSGQAFCEAGAITFLGSENNLKWYDKAIGGNLLHTGQNFTTQVHSDTSFYVTKAGEALSQTVGATDMQTGGWYNNESEFSYEMVFDALESLRLDYVTIFSEGNQSLNIRIKAANGTVLQEANKTLSSGENRVALGFQIAPGTEYTLALANPTANIWVNNTGSFPYTTNLISIKRAKTPWGSENWMTYFFKWEISTNNTCEAVKATAYLNANHPDCIITALENVHDSKTKVYPNPFSDLFVVESEAATSYRIVDLQGVEQDKGDITKEKVLGENLSSGVFILILQNSESKTCYKLTKE